MNASTRTRNRWPQIALLTAAASGFYLSCSSGLEGEDPKDTANSRQVPKSTNLRFGLDPGITLTHPLLDLELAGGVIPTTTGSRERPIALVAFATATKIDDADDATVDNVGVEDVFLAAVDADSIDRYAFDYSIASTMRAARCVACHQMNVDVTQDPTALPPLPFLTQKHFPDGGGKPPLNRFTDATCKTCHFEDWMAPGPTFDLRREGTRDLFFRAQIAPGGLDVHFKTDPRVLWALDDGATPFGGAADDDQDGIDEPEDHDGVRRHAVGGKRSFLENLDGWLATKDPATGLPKFSSAPDAVQDIVLASRNSAGTQPGNGVSRAPSIVYQPNPAFDPNNPTVAAAGFVHLAFQSNASNMIGGASNGFTDVFTAIVDVFVAANGKLNLVYRPGSQFLVSRSVNAGEEAKGDSTDPHIAANGTRVAFVSAAFDLVTGLPASCRPEVYLFDRGTVQNHLISHVPGSGLPGDAGAIHPDLSPDGNAVCFESDATDLVAGDTNGARDVFFALWPLLDVERASVPDGGGEFGTHSHGGTIFHAAGNVKVAFASQDVALAPVVSVQCPDQIAILTPAKDTSFSVNTPNTASNPTAPDLNIGTTGNAGASTGQARTVMQFDLASIPAGAIINDVTLSMVVNKEPDGTGGNCPAAIPNQIDLHVLTADWAEDASWNNRMPGTPWTTPGGDFDPAVRATLLVQGLGTKVWSDPHMADDVQTWLDSGSNFGWLLDGSDAQCTVKRLNSSETLSVPPTLTIDYTPPIAPLPVAGALVGASSVFLRDTALGRTIDLDQIVDPKGAVAPKELDIDGTPLLANATNPVISPYGNAVLFESMAQNIDSVRPVDENRLMDVFLVDLQRLDADGFVLPYKVSVTAEGGDANGPSHSPQFGSFSPPTDAFPLGIALFATHATNLGNADPGDLNQDGVLATEDNTMLLFLREGGSAIADFEVEPARQGIHKKVLFENTSSGKPDTFAWDFGDGGSSTKRSPTHVYANPGLYTVSLSVSGVLGADDRTRMDSVEVLGPVVATFSSTKDSSNAPAQAPAVDVLNTTTIAGAIDDANPASVLRFGMNSDGSSEFPDEFAWTLTRVNAGGAPIGPAVPVADEANPQDVEIDATGFYELTLEATGAGGLGSATQRLEIYQKVDAAFTTAPNGSPVRGPANLPVQFTDTSSGALLAANAHTWDFGDGAGSTLASPSHTYTEGVYFAKLTVAGKGTDVDTTATVPIIADGAITAAFLVEPQPTGSLAALLDGETIDSGAGALVDFENLSQNQAGSPQFHRWSFGTGALTGQELVADPVGISYHLSSPENVQTFGVHLVTSKINPPPGACGGQPVGTCNEISGSVKVYPVPNVDFVPPAASFSLPANRPPHTVQFFASVIGDGTGTSPTYRWLRSNANQPGASIAFATALNPLFEFPDPGLYKVALEVETDGPGGVRQVVRSAERDVLVSASTLTEWYTQAVQASSGARCTKCHAGASPPAGLNWLGTPPEIYNRIVEDATGAPVFSTRCNTARRRIEPGDPDLSVVFNVLSKPPGPLCSINMRINLPGDETEKDAHVAVLRSWILSGAPNN